MKTIFFAAALSVSGIALAQTSMDPQSTTPAPTDPMPADQMATGQTGSEDATGQMPTPGAPSVDPGMTSPSGVTTDDGTMPGDGVTQQGTDPNGMGVAPPTANQPWPNTGAGTVPAANQSDAFTPRAADAEYPACSKTVTDGCVQTYERGRRR